MRDNVQKISDVVSYMKGAAKRLSQVTVKVRYMFPESELLSDLDYEAQTLADQAFALENALDAKLNEDLAEAKAMTSGILHDMLNHDKLEDKGRV